MKQVSRLCLCLLLLSCSAERHGGTSTETTNGSIAGEVRHNGNGVAGARIALFFPDGSVYDSNAAVADSQGRFSIHNLRGRFHVGAEATGLKGWSFNHVAGTDTALRLNLDVPARLIISGLRDRDSVCLLGTPFCGAAEEGRVIFSSLPFNRYTVLVNRQPAMTAQIGDTLNQLNATVPQLQTDETLLEDFDDGDAFFPWAPYTGKGYWYVSAHGKAVLLQPQSSERPESAMLSTGAYEGKSLQVRYSGNDSSSANLVQVGLHLGAEPRDFRSLRQIRFAARGNCLLRVALETTLSDASFAKAIWDVPLDSNWREITIRTDDPISAPEFSEHVPFSRIAHQIQLLTFFAYGGTEFSLDRVRLVSETPIFW